MFNSKVSNFGLNLKYESNFDHKTLIGTRIYAVKVKKFINLIIM